MSPLYFCDCGAEIPEGQAPQITLDGKAEYRCRWCQLTALYRRSKMREETHAGR